MLKRVPLKCLKPAAKKMSWMLFLPFINRGSLSLIFLYPLTLSGFQCTWIWDVFFFYPNNLNVCRPGKTAEVPPAHCQNHPEARHPPGLRGDQKHHPDGAGSATGGPPGGSPREEEGQVWRPGHRLPQAGLEGEVSAHRGWLQRVLWVSHSTRPWAHWASPE